MFQNFKVPDILLLFVRASSAMTVLGADSAETRICRGICNTFALGAGGDHAEQAAGAASTRFTP